MPKQIKISNNINKNEIVVASCSSDEPIKRVEKILLLLGHLSISLNKKISWIHIGIENKEFMKKYLKKLNSYKKLNLILPGVVPNNEISNIYKKYKPDFFINLSSTEGVPVSIMEALSFGMPVIATNVGGTSEIINDSVGAIINSDIDFDVTINQIDRVIKSRVKLSKNAYLQWKTLCNDENNYIKFYKNLDEIKHDI